MPLFMDTHEGTELPTAMRQEIEGRVRSGEADRFGVVDRGVILDKEAGHMHCLLDAPDEDAVMQHHRALDVPIERESIHHADAILR